MTPLHLELADDDALPGIMKPIARQRDGLFRHPTQRATRLEEGRTSVTLQVRLCREIETWVLGFGEQARVMRPERLADIVASRLKTAADIYRQTRARPALAKAHRPQPESPRKKRAR